ncbi:plasmid stabilization system [Methylobacterium sp. 4-46]|uniref:type II toxin-antitoxin system RelE family toxin n=1 Tax=unclassified Methylobacterium TaxID=2615210 RepID=UPI000152DB4A|nr:MULTISPECIES: type II toxin-antitoxin system RelE/ParE family toxin [Methylobacterium]ACA18428.1 plasmid stabilization system [Methylobacterium sp. 4-46]WFT77721.1 type II toxin-antitoxin system RelE/ParE family toxin [Methylobacterium nodulans]
MKPIAYTLSATRELSRLPKPARLAIVEKLARYAATGAGDVRALTGRPGARLRVGDYRVVFVETDAQIEVRAIGHRRDIYD